VLLVKVAGKDTASVVDALTVKVQDLPADLRRSLTWDRGTELARHKQFTVATDVRVYVATPRARGSAAATRTPTACCASTCREAPICRTYTQPQLDVIALKLNTRPRKTLGYATPAAILEGVLR
jgi:IS30 family transposase